MSPYCSFFPPGKVILILQDESLMACLCGQTDCVSYSGTAAALQVFWSISCVQIKRTSSWHNYLENCFASVFKHVPWDSFWDSSPLPLPGELRACPCEKLLSTTARLANHPHTAPLQPRKQTWEVGFPNTNSIMYVPFAKNLCWLSTLPGCPRWDLSASADPHPRVRTQRAEPCRGLITAKWESLVALIFI